MFATNAKAKLAVFALIAVVLLAGVVMYHAEQDDAVVGDRFTVDGVTYEVLDEGLMTAKVVSTASTVKGVIPENEPEDINGYTIVEIGANAFKDRANVTSVFYPYANVVGNGAFQNCTGLTKVTLDIRYWNDIVIGNNAFNGCTNLAAVDGAIITSLGSYAFAYTAIGSFNATDLTSLGDHAFYRNTALYMLTNLKCDIGTEAFAGCSSLTTLNNRVIVGDINIGAGAFKGSGLMNVNVPFVAKSIGNNAFEGCSSLRTFTFKDINSIGAYAFSTCTALTSISDVGKVTSVGNYAFKDCSSLSTVTCGGVRGAAGTFSFGKDLDSFGEYVFDCSNVGGTYPVKNIVVDAANTHYGSVDGVLYSLSGSPLAPTTLVCCPPGKDTAVTVPSGVTTIAKDSFYYCSSVKSVTLPESISNIVLTPVYKTVDGRSVLDGWRSPFFHCNAMTSITLNDDADNTHYVTDNGALYTTGYDTLLVCPAGIKGVSITWSVDGKTYPGCYQVHSNTTKIAPYAFEVSKLTNVILGSQVNDIHNTSFRSMRSLQDILIDPANQTYDSANGILFKILDSERVSVLSAAGGRTSLTIPAKVNSRKVVSIESQAFYNSAVTSVTFGTDTGGETYLTDIGSSAFSWSSLQGITLPDSVTTIGDSAFNACQSSGMTSITLGANAQNIGKNAFARCINLQSFTVSPENKYLVTYDGALYSGTYDAESGKVIPKVLIVCPAGLSSVEIAPTTEEISDNAFYYCRNLTTITIPASVTTVGADAFRYCDSLTEIVLDIGVDFQEIGANAFALSEYNSTTHRTGLVCNVQGADEGYLDAYTDIYTKFTYRHVVYYNVNGGEGDVPDPVYKKTGDGITLDDTFRGTRTGYDFVGWKVRQGGDETNYLIYDPETLTPTGNSLDVVIGGSNTEILAYWYPYTYKIRFNPNSGTGAMDMETFTYDVFKPLTTNTFTRVGYSFLGWSDDMNDTEAKYLDNFQNPENWTAVKNDVINIYAIWEANPVTVHFDGNKPLKSEVSPGVPDDKVVRYDGEYGALTDATLVGYIFRGWWTDPSPGQGTQISAGTVVTTIAAEQTLYAHWEPITYSISFNRNGADGGADVASFTATYDEVYDAPACTWTRTGYTFQNWKLNETIYAVGADLKNLSTTKDAQVVLVAQWTANTYQLSFDAQGGTPAPATRDLVYDSQYGALPVVTKTGYTFQGWYTAADGGTVIESTTVYHVNAGVPGDHTLYAHWSADSHTVTFNANGGSSPSPASKPVTYDDEYGDLATTSRTGYTFAGWWTTADGGVQVTSSTTVKITENQTLFAHWTANVYTVTFKGNDQGTSHAVVVTASKSVTFDAAYGELSAVTMTGYTFQGWYTAANGGTLVTAETILTTPASDHNLYAHWTADVHTVTFNGNTGDTPDPTSKPVTYDATYGELATVSKTGYTFQGWFTQAVDGTKVISTDRVLITTDITLYAHWTANTYNVVFNGNGNTGGSMSNQGLTWDDAVERHLTSNAFTKTGYTFVKWNTKSDGTGVDYADGAVVHNLTSVPNGTFNLYAVWIANTYSVVFNGNGNTGGSMSNQGLTWDDAVERHLTTNAFTRTGYTFVKWNTAADGSGTDYANEAVVKNLTSTPNGTFDLYAIWSANTYNLIFHGNEPSTTEGHASVPANKPVVFDATYGDLTPSELVGYTFDGWFNAASGGTKILSTAIVDVAADQDLYAHWTVKTFDITFNGNKPGSSTPVVPGVKNVTYDATYGALTDATTAGYTFVGWFTEAEEGTQVISSDRVLITSNTTLYAHWTVNTYTVTFVGNDQGTSHAVVETASIDVVFDTAYGELSEVTMTGYTFVGWFTEAEEGTKVTAETILTTPASNHNLYAHWTANTYIVSFDNNGSDHSPSFLSMEVTYDQQYGSLPTNLRTSYTLVGWFTEREGGTQVISTDRVLITANQVLYAHWNLKAKHTITFSDDALPNHPTAVIPTYDDLVEDGTLTLPEWNYTQGPDGTGNPFIGWKCNDGVTYPAGSTFTMGTVNATFQAWYDGAGYLSLTYHSNYSTPTEKTYVMKVQAGVNLPAANGGTTFTDKTGYKFIGWAESEDGAVKYTSGQKFDMPSTNYDLYAKWEPIKYKVMYMTTNGVGTTAQQENLVYDQVYTALQNPFTLTGYENIAGWALAENLVNDTSGRIVEDGGTFSNLSAVDGSTVYLFPIWIPNTYTIVFNGNGADPSPAGPATIDATYAVSYCVPGNTFAKEGYDTFVRWNTQADGNGVSFYPCQCPNPLECRNESDTPCYTHVCTCCLYNLVTENGGSITLYAIWSINHYNVVFNTNGGTPVPESQVIAHGEKVTAPVTTTRDGYVFKAWFMDSGLTQPFRFSTEIVKDFEGHRLVNNQTLTLYAGWYTLVTVPTARGDLVFNNAEQMGVVPAGGAVYSIAGNTGTNATSATNTYSATVSFTSDQLDTYMWNVDSVISKWSTYYASFQEGAAWDVSQGTVSDQSIPWSIAKKPLAQAMLTLSGEYTYDGSLKTVTYTVIDGTEQDNKITVADYGVSGHTRTDQGTQNIVISATDRNYSGSIELPWTVQKRALSNATLTLSPPVGGFTYNGEYQDIDYAVTDVVGETVIIKGADYTVSGYHHRNHGTYSVTVTATDGGNYTGSIHEDWTIQQKTLTDGMLQFTPVVGGYVFNGADQTVLFTVIDGTEQDNKIIASDYSVTGKTHSEHGEYNLVIAATPEGNYTGSITKSWVIQKKDLGTITLTPATGYVYNGQERTVTFTAVDGSPSILRSTDYTVRTGTDTRTDQGKQYLYLDATDAGNYTGFVRAEWEIAKKDISDTMFAFTYDPLTHYVYTGLSQTVDFTMTDGSPNIIKGTDYSAVNHVKTDVGTYTVTISSTDAGNYTGSFTKTWKILPAQLSLTQNESFTYNAGTSWDVTATGVNGETKTVTLNLSAAGIGVYAATGDKTFTATSDTAVNTNYVAGVNLAGHTVTVTKKDLADSMLALSGSYVYNGGPQTVTYEVSDAAALIVAGDYTVTGQTRTNQGTQKIIITATVGGNYDGSIEREWTIAKKPLAVAMLNVSGEYTFNGAEQFVTYTVIDGTAQANKITTDDYDVDGNSRTNQGTQNIVISATNDGNYSGSIQLPWTIQKKALAASMLTFNGTYTYSGVQQTVDYTMADPEARIVRSDYDISDLTGLNKGAYEVTVTATDAGNYSGSFTKSWNILPATLSLIRDESFVFKNGNTWEISAAGVNRETKTVTVTLSDKNVGIYAATGEKTFTAVSDTAVNTNYVAGVTIGEHTVTITKKPLADAMLHVSGAYVYNGSSQTVTHSVSDPAALLVLNDDYTVSGESRTDQGSQNIVISATDEGNYSGSIEREWTIAKKPFTVGMLAISGSYTYDGTLQYVSYTVIDGTAQENKIKTTDYDVTGDSRTNQGTQDIVITETDNGNYSGSLRLSWTIAKRALTQGMLSLSGEYTYNGATQEVTHSVTDGSPSIITEADYEMTGHEQKLAGTHTVTVSATDEGNYTGTITANWVIQKMTLTVPAMTDREKIYDGLSSFNEVVAGVQGVQPGDAVSVLAHVTFDKNVGPDNRMTITYTLSGEGYANYNDVTDDTSVPKYMDISKRPITVAGTSAAGRVYDGTVEAMDLVTIGNDWSNIVAADSGKVTPVITAAEFVTKVVGSRQIMITYDLTGEEKDNYSVSGNNPYATISVKDIHVLDTTTVDSKTYDGLALAHVNLVFAESDIVDGDTVSMIATGVFSDVNVGENKDVTIIYTLSGFDSVNYRVNSDSVSQKHADITPVILQLPDREITYDADTYYLDFDFIGVNGEVINATYTAATVDAGVYEYSKVYAAGHYTVTLHFGALSTDNYTVPDDFDATFTILPKTLTIGVATSNKDYDGTTDATVDLTVTGVEEMDLEKVTVTPTAVFADANIGVSKNVTVDFAITGDRASNYRADTVHTYATISPKNISEGIAFTLVGETPVYDGTIHTVTVDAVYTAYPGVEVTYFLINNIASESGDYTLTVNGTGNFTGSKNVAWTVGQRNITNAVLTIIGTNTYTGSSQNVSFSVTDIIGGADWITTSDYTVEGNSGINVDEYTLVIRSTPGGNYYGTISEVWNILPKNISSASITGIREPTYDGTEHTVDFDVKDNNTTLVAGTDYTYTGNTGDVVGIYHVRVYGTGNYTGETSVAWKVLPKNLTSSMVSITGTYTYNGSQQTVRYTVTDGEVLQRNTDYMVGVRDSDKGTDAGSYLLTLSGTGNYTGSVYIPWSIGKRALADSMIVVEDTYTYNGSAQDLDFKVIDGTEANNKIKPGDYDVEGNSYTDAGSYTLRIIATFDGNYSGSAVYHWSIGQKTLTAQMVSTPVTSYEFNGEYQTIGYTVSDGTALTADDYLVIGTTYRNVGSYNMTVTGAQNYTGTVIVPWTIDKKALAESMITLSGSYTYNGMLQSVSYVVADGAEGTLRATDFTVSGNTGTNADTYSFTITAKDGGNYSGSASKTWTIEKLSVASAVVSLGDALTYNGAQQTMHATVTAMGLTATVDITGNTGTDAGNYTLTATGTGNFKDSVSKDWSIGRLSIVAGTVTLEDELTYSGALQTMHATVTVGELTATVDVTGNTGTDAKDYRLFANGTGNFSGSVSQLWSIAKKTLTEEMVSVPKTSYVYNGAYQTIGCTVSDGTAMTAADYSVTGLTYRYVGEYEIVVTASHNYEGTVTVPWEITQKPLAESMITINGTMTYNGALQMVSFTVFDGAEGSILATDYTVSGNSGTNAGNYTLTITATQDGNYSGSASKAWAIEQLSISRAVVTLGDALIYNGAQQTMHATVITMGLTVTADFTGNTGTDAGDYTLTATGTGNFKDSVSKDWSIAKLSIVAGTVTLEDELTYNGSEQTMRASVSVNDLAATTNLAATVTLSGNTGTDAGGYVLTATGTGNFTGSVSKSWAIAKKTLTEEMVSTPVTSFVYDGTLRTIGCTVSDGTAMTSADYTVSGNVYKNVGSYTLTVTAGHNYTGIVTRDWAITQKALTADMITINGSLTYDGAQQTVSYTISDGEEGTIMASDFIASGYNGTDAGTYTLKIEAKPTGNYSGSATKDWTIERLSISRAVVTLGDTLTYNGQEQTMHPVIITMGLTVTFDVTGNTGTDAGNYTLTATGTGNFKDSVEKGWSIAKLSVITGTVTFGDTLTYNGEMQTMPVTVTVNGLTATVDVTGNTGTDAGDYDMTATGNGNFTGSISKMWTIGRLSIDNATVTLDDTLTYNGHSQIMPVTVTVDGHTATVDVVGNEKTNAGDYTLTATGTGNFTGSVSKNWNLGRLSVADADVRLIDQFTYNGETQVMSVIVTVDELNATVELSDNSGVDAGSYTLTATGVGNFTGTVTKDWTIAQKALADYMVIVSGAYTYNGADQNVSFKVIDGSEEVNRITPDDYTVTGQTGKDHGVYDLVVTAAATGNYTGTARTTWSIAQKSLENSMVSTSGTYTYNGTAQTVEYAVADETFLVPADYTVSGQTHTDYGTYELVITATATGNYTGIAKTSWSIEKLSVENATIILGDALIYNGQLQTMSVTVSVGELPATVEVLGNNHADAGTYTMSITGYGNFKGTVTRDWTIEKLSVATGTVTLDDELVYNGKTQTMPATVTVNGLTATVAITGNKQMAAGDYSLTATGTGNFTGTIGQDWSISRLSIEHAVVIYDNDLTYTGEELTRTATVMVNGLVADVTYSGNTGVDAGDYTMTITGVGNFVDSIDKAWSIIKKEFKASFVHVENDRLPYTGFEQMLQYTVTDGQPSAITADDYTVNSGDRGTEIGEYSLVLMATDDGNYTGNVIINWAIIPGMVVVTLDTDEGVFAAVGWTHIVGSIYSKQFGNNVLWGEVIDDIGTVERYGYTFTGYLPEVDVDAEVGLGGGSLTAQWSINGYTVTVTQPAYGVISVDGYTLVDDKVTVPYLTDLTFSYAGAEGYYLTSWIGADEDGALTVIADCVVSCTLGHTYAVIFDARGVITETQQEYGQPVQLISRPGNVDVDGTHYIFCGWDGYVEGMLVDGEMSFTAWYSVVYSDTTKTATIVRDGVLELDETSIEDILNSDDEYIRIYGSDANVLMKMSTFANMTTEGKFTLVLDKTEDILTPEQKKAIGNSYSIMVEAWNGDVQVHQIGNEVLVCIPFELKNGVTADRLMVYYVDDHGRMEKYDSTYYDFDQKAVCFYTNHFSTFMVCTDYGVITMAQIAFVFTFIILVICFAYYCHRHYRGKRAKMESETSQ